MGIVYRARDRKRKREVALKLLLSDRHADDEGHERFKREARSLARLSHPGIVKVFDYGVNNGLPYLSMEFVPGRTLQSLLDGNALRLLPGVDVLLKVAQAIDHAHSRGVVHRDLKPANVLIGADNRPRISDFGLAKLDDGRITLTHDGDIVGTPLYMSPEQIQGALAQVGPSTDVWALGVMLYRVLTGSLPFNGTTVEEVSREVVNKTPVPPRSLVPDVPEDLERVCLTALRKAPHERYQSAGEFARDLGAYLQGAPVLAGRVTPAMRARRGYRALRIYAPTLLPGMLVVLSLGLLAGWLAFPPSSGGGLAAAEGSLETLVGRAEQAWRERAYDRAARALDGAQEAARSDDPTLAARLAALQARRTESLPALEAALST
ncbi:MAG: serine/threonine protein kinase, partial [Planctomycetes bacterium]|nr:serine/threonine protein kinase [Planctomycetota bacterium]